MNVLEKILEEIEEKIKLAGRMMVEKPCDKLDEIANDTAEAFIGAYEECSEIIRSHMDDGKDANVPSNDGWIPVEEWCLILRICYMREPDHGWHRNTEFFQKIGERI